MKLFKKWFKKEKKPEIEHDYNLVGDFSISGITNPIFTSTVTAPTTMPSSSYTIGATSTSSYSISSYPITSGITIGPMTSPNIIVFANSGKEIVKLTKDGEVEWPSGIRVDEASKAFAKSLILSSELASGITSRVKTNMRDSVFNDLISIAKEKGSLTADDLTYLLEASKIVEKLKGGEKDE